MAEYEVLCFFFFGRQGFSSFPKVSVTVAEYHNK
jgi:hypothetical protein